MLQADNCFCDAQLEKRGPFESEVISAYQPAVANLTLDCINSAGDCFFGSTFDTTVVLAFEEQDDVTVGFKAFTETILETFRATISAFYQSDDTSCNPDFRIFINTTAFADSFIYNGVDLNETDVMGERLLYEARYLQDLQNVTIGTNDTNTSAFPSSAPTAAATLAPPGFVYVLLFASGVCNGCPNDLFLNNQVNRRQLQTMVDPFRELQDVLNAESNCFCPIGSEIVETQFTKQAIGEELAVKFEEAGVPGFTEIDEPSSFVWDGDTSPFTSTFTFQFVADFCVR